MFAVVKYMNNHVGNVYATFLICLCILFAEQRTVLFSVNSVKISTNTKDISNIHFNDNCHINETSIIPIGATYQNELLYQSY